MANENQRIAVTTANPAFSYSINAAGSQTSETFSLPITAGELEDIIAALPEYQNSIVSVSGAVTLSSGTYSGLFNVLFTGGLNVPQLEVKQTNEIYSLDLSSFENDQFLGFKLSGIDSYSPSITKASSNSDIEDAILAAYSSGEKHHLIASGADGPATVYDTVVVNPGDLAADIQVDVRAKGGDYANVVVSGSTTTPIAADVSGLGTPQVGGSANGNNTASNLFDGDDATYWAPGNSIGVGDFEAAYAGRDLGTAIAVNRIQVTACTELGATFENISFKVMGSNSSFGDASAVTLDTKLNQSISQGETKEYTFLNSTAYRYVWLSFAGNEGTPYVYVGELKFFRTPVASTGSYTITFDEEDGNVPDITNTPGTNWSTSVTPLVSTDISDCRVSGSGNTRYVEFIGNSGGVNVPDLELWAGSVGSFLVSTGDSDGYTWNGGDEFELGITEANLQVNQREIGGEYEDVIVKGESVAPVEGTGTVTFSGAGTAGVNVEFTPVSTSNGKAFYFEDLGGAGYALEWSGERWEVKDNNNTVFYYNVADTEYPPATGWAVGSGSSPAPSAYHDIGSAGSASFKAYYPLSAEPAAPSATGTGASASFLVNRGNTSKSSRLANYNDPALGFSVVTTIAGGNNASYNVITESGETEPVELGANPSTSGYVFSAEVWRVDDEDSDLSIIVEHSDDGDFSGEEEELVSVENINSIGTYRVASTSLSAEVKPFVRVRYDITGGTNPGYVVWPSLARYRPVSLEI